MSSEGYSYILLQYVHDVLAEERLNVGIILLAPQQKFLSGKFVSKTGRLSHAFPDMHTKSLKVALKSIETSVKQRQDEYIQRDFFRGNFSLKNFAYSINLQDDSALQWSDEKYGRLFDDPNVLLEKLFSVYVSRYDSSETAKNRVEQNLELSVRDSLSSLGALIPFEQQTFKRVDSITFQHAWKDDRWYAFEAISLNFKQQKAILRKAREWRGHLDAALDTKSGVDLKLWLILVEPTNTELKDTYHQAREIIEGAEIRPNLLAEEFAVETISQSLSLRLKQNKSQIQLKLSSQ